jgi:hypothetical protein
MIDRWERSQKSYKGRHALTSSFRCDRLSIEMSDEASSYQTFRHIKSLGPRGRWASLQLSDKVGRFRK